MKKVTTKVISLILSVALILSTFTVVFAHAEAKITTVSSLNEAAGVVSAKDFPRDEVYPSIIIHGIGQADTYMVDENGDRVLDRNGEAITGWPVHVDAMELVKGLLVPLILSVIFQRDIGLTAATHKVASDLLSDLAYNEDATPTHSYQVEGYDNKCFAECTQEQKDTIFRNVPLQDYAEAVGEENLYYFAYDSFGDIYDIVDQLEAIIEKAKRETGKDKVNLVPISLGGAVSVAYVGEHPDGADLNKIVFIVPALDGSEIVGKVMLGQLDYSDEGIYRTMFTKLVGEDDYTGWLINIVLRLLPKQLFIDMFAQVAEGLTEGTLSRVTTMWGLVPSSMYDELAARYLTPGTELTRRVEKFHNAQINMVKNLKSYEANGIGIYDVCGYGLQLYSLIDSDSNSDKIIHSSSTSIGATFSKVGETLPDGYVQKAYPEYNFISPDRQVDASTCAFPMTTWFFGGQDHESIGANDVVVRLASFILVAAKDVNVFSTSDYPQFNTHRRTDDLADTVKFAKTVDLSTLDAGTADRLQKAISAAEINLAKTVIVVGETEAAEAELEAALIEAGAKEKGNDTLDKILLFLCKGTSEALYYFWGPRGFFE
ncbi:MAG: lysophospholipase [Clostridia bacterium]|nr:lysophospholipase [Clostridia bacterium]